MTPATDDRPPVVLVVDDDHDLRAIYEVELRAAGFSPRLAVNGAEGVEHLKVERPDAIICDMAMAGGSGLMVIDAVRDNPNLAQLPIVAVSGLSPDDDLWSGLSPRWDIFIQKPANLEEIIRVVRDLIDARRARG